ncbi:MAG: methyltransferase [Candidatus Bathyarchaeota archaeon]|nr:methyltransferase [Candidatus Bathyarchaeota archaeon]MDH5787319.1 methyltransferase [Candidatus Bathyarchaeota archaeon]
MPQKTGSQDHYFAKHPKSKLELGVIRTNLRGRTFEFLTASGVFSKKRLDLGTRLLIESMILPDEGRVLDIGCGYGAVGIAAAVFNPNLHVVLVDVNERAVWLARENIEINSAINAEVKRGHLYEPVRGLSFSCVFSNPPVSAGMETVKAIIAGASEHMLHKALLQMVVKSKVGGKRLQMIFKETFGNVAILARKSGYRVLVAQKE